MPLSHTRAFRVRHYECDSFGYLAPACYLRYMQETAFDASAAAGYDMARYRSMGRTWLIRETDIAYLRPLRYGDSVEVRTWVADFRRVRSRRAYEFRNASTSEVAAHAVTDWAFIDTNTGRPASVPHEMIAAFIPEGIAEAGPARCHLDSPVPPAGAVRFRRVVQWSDLDPAMHVNNAVFLSYIEDGAAAAEACCGWPPMPSASGRVRTFARRHQIAYLLPALLGDELDLILWISELGSALAVRRCEIVRVRDGASLVRARTEWGCLETSTDRWVSIPEQLKRALAPITASSA